MSETLTLSPTTDPRIFLAPDGRRLSPPPGWECLPPGDAALTRRVKLAGPSWSVVEKKGRKLFSRGLWAPAATIEQLRAALAAERSTESYAKKRVADVARREREQAAYVVDFERAVLDFLRFAPRWQALARTLAARVAAHATPVGSGTVARTERIPVAERAEAAVIAWMRHQTTAYDRMSILRIKGERREVRRRLAQRSRELLERYRRGEAVAPDCPLAAALAARTREPTAPRTPEPLAARAQERPAAREHEPLDVPDARPIARAPVQRPTPEHPAGGEGDQDHRLARMRAVRERLGRR